MKVLITGKNSYIGQKVCSYIENKEPMWELYQLDVIGDAWRSFSFEGYDAVYHVAGIAHRKIKKEIERLYYSVNRDLAIEIANKAKEENVGQFVFMSSMSVYSDNTTYVDRNTATQPDNAYGDSKLQAEKSILDLMDESFLVSILRPPMIYGKGCKGNYNSLRRIALTTPIFPKVNNRRSMLYIDNLSEFVYQVLLRKEKGIFFPQNRELVNTTQWAKFIAEENGRKLYTSRVLGLCTQIGKHIPGISDYCVKAFGDSYYDYEMSAVDGVDYQLVSFRESIHATEKQ